jgi:hypothetical protein
MLKTARILALIVGSLAAALTPCAPALASIEVCRMSGCATNPDSMIRAADCCCAISNVPAAERVPVTIAGSLTKAALSQMSADTDPSSAGLFLADVALDPPSHVPLFILHSTLLI